MKAKIVIYVVALFCAKAHAQQCYECASITTDGVDLDLPATEDGFVSCDGPLKIVNCDLTGGCTKADFSLSYDITGTGRVNVGLVLRTCGTRADTCLSNSEVQQVIDIQRGAIDAMLPAGVDFFSGSGNACVCSSSLCNGAPVWKISFGSILMSLLVSYIATKL